MSWQPLKAEVTTPMFCGRGGTTADTFRISELRGALRFWVRALVPDEPSAKALADKVFGRASDHNTDGTSPVRFRPVKLPALTKTATADAPQWHNEKWSGGPRPEAETVAVSYLLGPGIFVPRRRGGPPAHLEREFVDVGEEVGLKADVCDHGPLVASAAWLLAVFGGVGRRFHRGFGGLRFGTDDLATLAGSDFPPCKVNDFYNPALVGAVVDFARSPNTPPPTGEPALTPDHSYLTVSCPGESWLSSGSPWLCVLPERTFNTWSAAAAFAAERLRTFRASKDRSPGKTGFKRWVTSEYQQTHTSGIEEFSIGSFGLPVNFPRKFNVEPAHYHRRASPLWLRPVRVGNDWRLLAHAFLSKFMNGDALRCKPTNDFLGSLGSPRLDQATVDATLRQFLESLIR